ncbi:MAG: amidohydrolase family protein [Armatimonadetes bacterium]|nr:amidohydrolase family protein [Armatimonadota bacterium]
MINAAALVLALSATGPLQQSGPFELPEHRVPKTVTNGNALIRNATVLTVTNGDLESTDVLIRDGKIAEIGRSLSAPSGFVVIDATGKHLMPGIVDTHSHRGIDGTNEGSESIVAEVRMQDVINPTAKSIWQALASGHTAGLLLHGSANPIGGESVVVKYKYNTSVEDFLIPDAPRMIKFALGENVTRKSSTSNRRFPSTRMGVEAVYRRAFEQARAYRAKQDAGEEVAMDVRLETLADILAGKVWVHCHSYRADEMLMMVRLSQEFGFKIGAMQHALEAYKIAPEMAAAGVGAGMFADHWGYKIEAYDAIPFNAAICYHAGMTVSINTDGLSGTSALNIDAAKVMRFGGVPANEALKMLTINPASQLGIDHRTGSIEVGKDADLALWDGHPLSVYSKPIMTMIEGVVYFERRDAFGVDGITPTVKNLPPVNYEREPNVPASADTYVIVGATIHTVTGGVIDGKYLIVSNGKIQAFADSFEVGPDGTVIDATGMHVYPGFIDGGTQIGLVEVSGIRQTNDGRELGTHQPDLRASTALYVESAYMGTDRYAGVTHSFTRPSGGTISGQGALIQHHGLTTEQIAMQPDAALVVNFPNTSRYPKLSLFNQLCCDADDWASIGLEWLDGLIPPPSEHDHDTVFPTQEEQERELPRRIKALDEYFQKALEYAKNRPSERDLQLEAMIPYVTGQKPVLLRVRSAATIRAAVDFAKRNNLRVILAGAAEAWREAEMLARENIPVLIPPAGRSTLSANNTTNEYDPYDTPYVVPYLLAKAGVKFGFESGGNATSMMLPFRVGMSCAYGLSHDDAIKALTIWPAEMFGVADRLGSIEVGKAANFIITDGDPFELTTNMKYVFIAGQPVPLVSRHTYFRDKYWARLKDRR